MPVALLVDLGSGQTLFAKEPDRRFMPASITKVIADEHSWGDRPRLHVVDNVDPRSVAGVFDLIELSRTLFLVISKSGGTAETMAQYLYVRHRIDEQGLLAAHHVAVVTDPTAGVLRPVAERDGLPVFSVPANVGGRFSLFTPVATLPAALVGIDVTALRTGAAAMGQACETEVLDANPAGQFAMLQWRAHTGAGQGTHVLMPYSDAMRGLAPWFVQLWAESLGKKGLGTTPVRALGNVVDEWKKMTKSNSPPTLAVTIVHNDYLAKNADAVAKFIAATRKAVEWGSKNKTQVADILRKVANMDATDSLAYANQWDSAYFASFEPQDIAALIRMNQIFMAAGSAKKDVPDSAFLTAPYIKSKQIK